jgi:CHAD domain-containing protein
MTKSLAASSSPVQDVRSIARRLVEQANGHLNGLDDAAPDQLADDIHEFRKCCKESRALAQMIASTTGRSGRRFDRALSSAARQLSATRDAHIIADTLAKLDLDRGAVPMPPETAAEAVAPTAVATAATRIAEALAELATWESAKGFEPIAAGVERSYRSARRRLAVLRDDDCDEHLHAWRKAVKRFWYQVRVLERSAPSMLRPLSTVLADLAELLGDDHDVSVLIADISANPDRYGGSPAADEAIAAASERQRALRRAAVRLGSTIFAERPPAFRCRIEAYWELTRNEGPEEGDEARN